ncbi:MAG TPA: hypothetical protein VGH67_18535 [Solirubrobacteraceae bacterium]|jgi:hypothetical protein
MAPVADTGADSRYGEVTVRRCIGISLAVAASAALLSGVRVGAAVAPAAAAGIRARSPDALVARLAVLRRPQTPADMLPSGTRLPPPGGTILPALTRLVATLPGDLKAYLVVTTPTGGALPLWSPRLGDQISVVAKGPHATGFETPYPAVDLNDPLNVGRVGNGAPRTPLADAHNIAILPDGVSRVRWRFAKLSGGRDAVQTATVTNNVAVAPSLRNAVLPDGATWYAPDGTAVPTSDTALVRAVAAMRAALKARAVRDAQRHSRQAAPSLLAAFAVFSVTSRHPVREPGGITVARPRLADVPLPILDVLSHMPGQLDAHQMRAIATRAGDQMWLIPGARGLCLAVMDKPVAASPLSGGGAGAVCATNLTQVEAQGIGLGEGRPGASVSFGILPRSKPTITVTIGGHRRVIRPPFGVYVLRHGPPHPRTGTVIVSLSRDG